jgi:hypothetical protein
MMKYLNTLAVISLLIAGSVTTIGCSQKTAAFEPDNTPGLANPSIHIKIIKENIPVKGTSYGWGVSMFRIPEKFGVSLSDLGTRISASLTKELTAKEMQFSENEPDYYISYAIAFASEIHEVELDNAYDGLLEGELAHEQSDLYYKQGVLIIDVVSRKDKTLLWRGAILAEPDMEWPEKRKQERCDTAVHEVLKYFPKP